MIGALYHTEQDDSFTGKDAGIFIFNLVQLKALATEVLNHLQESSDANAYVQAYQAVRNNVQEKRRSRKEQKIMLAVTDPKLSAQSKLKKNLLKVAQRKRKTARYTDEKIRRGKIQRVS